MDEVQLAILNLLQTQAIGSSNAMNADEIFNVLTSQNVSVMQGRTQEQIRAAVRSMIKDHAQLIGSNSGYGTNNGYFMINNKDEVFHTIMDPVLRSKGMLERVEALKTLWNNQNPTDKI